MKFADCTTQSYQTPARSALALACLLLAGAGCDASLGVVGSAGLTATGTFTGITDANILSPTSVKIAWNTSSDYTTYSVYSSASPFPLGNTIFSSYTATGLTPATVYSFSVGGTSTSSGSIDGLGVVKKLTSWPQFAGLTTLVASSPISLQANWTFNDPSGAPITGPNFKVYVVQGSAAPSDFTTSVASTTGTSIGITQLADGSPILANTTYTVIVRATYLDGTSEFNQNALTVTTPSNINPLPTIKSDAVIIGSWPTITVSGALASYTTSFALTTYPSGPTGPTGSQNLGSVTGNNVFKDPSSQPIAWGQNTITPTVTSQGSSVALPPITVTSRIFKDKMIDFPAFSAVTGPSGTLLPRGAQRLGSAMAVGDFNCDGYQDLAVAAPYGSFNPTFAQGANDGGVYVYYGSSSGLITNPAPSTTPINSTAPLLVTRPNMGANYGGELFGYSLAAGNLNGDTNPNGNSKACDELAVGTWGSNEVWVFFGSSQGLQYSGSPVDSGSACSGSVCAPLRIGLPAGSNYTNPFFGSSLAIGKLHQPVGGDTYRDLLIGGPYEQAPGKDRGGAWVLYGGSSGINYTNPPSQASTGLPYTKYLPQAAVGAPQWNFSYGIAVAALDMDGDGIDDIAIGAPLTNANCLAQGSIYYYSSKTNTVASTGFFPATSTYTMLTNPVNRNTAGCANYVRFGGYLANAGDVNGDGYQDLVVNDGDTNLGWIWGSSTYGATVFYGGTNGPQTTNGCASLKNIVGNSSPACATNVTASCGTAAGLAAGQCKVLNIPYAASSYPGLYYSHTVAGASANSVMNDVNGDGYADFMVGWPLGSSANGQRADVYYGGPNGVSPSFSKLTPLVSNLTTDNFGMTVALGNFNSSLYSSVVAASPDNMTLNGAYGGAVFVFNGQAGGLPSNVTSYSKALTPNSSKEYGGAGIAVSIGDVNGDGYTDVAYRFSRWQSSGRTNGQYAQYTEFDVVILYGSSTGLVTSPTPVLNPLHKTDPLLIPAANPVYPIPYMQAVGAAGDVNGDGYADIVVGDATGGIIYLYYGSSTGLQTSVLPTVPPTTGLNPVIVGQSDGTSSNIWYNDVFRFNDNPFGTGDFNGDGYSDIVVGSGYEFGGSKGAALVIFGGAQGIQTDGVLQRTLTGGPNVALTKPCTGSVPNLTCKAQLLLGGAESYFANTVAGVGDVNKDGFADLIVSSPYNNFAGSNNGAVYLYMGSPSGMLLWDSSTSTFDTAAGTTTGLVLTPPLLTPGMVNRYLSQSIGPAGDVNGDGFADFVVGSSQEQNPYGGAFLFYGCGNGLNNSAVTPGCPSTGVWGVPVPPVLASVGTIVVNGPSCTTTSCSPLFFYPNLTSVANLTGGYPGYYWGRHIGGVGDVNKDGYSDVVQATDFYSWGTFHVCSSPACPTNIINSGNAVLFTGSATGLVTTGAVTTTPSCNGGVCTPYWITPSMANWGAPGTPSYYYYGYGMTFNNPSPADFNGDGFPDFFITSPAYMNGSQTTSFLGGMYVFQ